MTTERTTGRRSPTSRRPPTCSQARPRTCTSTAPARSWRRRGIDPVVTMEIFSRGSGILCGAEESLAYLREIFSEANGTNVPIVESLHDGDPFGSKEVVMRIQARYSAFGLYETAILGILASGSGWATAARQIVDAAAPIPVIGFGARHVHPSVADQMDYASVVGGCIGASTPAGARLAGLAPTGTMPHALVLIFGDTVRAAEAFDRHIDPAVPRIILVDTFKDEAEESLRVAEALGDRLWGVRLDTPSERGPRYAGAREGGSCAARPRRPSAREDRRLRRASTWIASASSRMRVRRSTRSPSGRTSARRVRSTSPATSRRSMARRSPSAAASRVARRTPGWSGSTSPR